jgi:tRNA 2-selenouridine synthase
MEAHRSGFASVDEIHSFDAILDVRSPAEFALDHLPGARNLPVLYDEERARVGTVYTGDSPFEARKLGAAIVARNIARHLDESLHAMPRSWRPLVYCWRGGQRSGAMATILTQIGWAARRLEGGYRAFRRRVLSDLETLPARSQWVVIQGPTGSGKTALLGALARQGAQVLDLEALARHRGSVLGGGEIVGIDQQPGQRAFETAIWDVLRRVGTGRPVFVEAESRRIGRLGIPGEIFAILRMAPRVQLEVPLGERVDFLVRDYRDAQLRPEALAAQLQRLAPLHGHRQIDAWRAMVGRGEWTALARDLVVRHYDPAYRRGVEAALRAGPPGPGAPGADGGAPATVAGAAPGHAWNVVQIPRLDEPCLDAAASEVLRRFGGQAT